VKDKRPVNLDIGTINLPLAALTSITHRVSGVIVFVGIAVLLWLFDASLTSEEGFNSLGGLAGSFLGKFVLWGVLTALAYHMVAGCKHLLLDIGIGETKEAAPIGAKIVIVVSVVLAAVLGVWIW
jgi:succinate dehydrogenase / fumarate reductase cytochrome b subunit